ncbi:hypothetical protein EQM14_00865 [Caproiciproducens sp. NJN-50]|uniref:hypothetical protein n=1 Tax=Acutalibacteraceae TaxID=3082771 RepID=UPI000FFE2349|nr:MULTISPECIES: hypothetical protein [Acutalibacteraceae]QAT48447.1 hypothetical protein EQM14_00865 [Caproiciproducens sp. NJN-50]
MKHKIRTEAFDLMQYFYSSAHDPLIRALIRFSGRLDPDVLRRAVDLSASSVPQIRCVFSAESRGWEDRGFSANRIVRVTEAGEKNAAERLLLDTIKLDSEPQLKIHLVRGPGSDTLCVILSHLAADGTGFKQYLYLLASLYRRCAETPGTIVPPEPLDRGVGQIFRGMGLTERLRILRAPMDCRKQEKEMYLPTEEEQGEPVTVLRRAGGELFSALKQYAKKAGVTVNDVLLTAYGRAHFSLTGCADLEIPCPVDLRKYLPDGARCGICNLTGNYVCRVSPEKGELFRETLKRVAAQMSGQKGSRNCLKGPMLLDFLFTVLPYPARKKVFDRNFSIPVISFTNLGVLDGKRLDFGNGKIEDAYLTTAVKHPPSFQISVSTLGNCCTLGSSLYATEKNRSVAERFLDGMISELELAVSENPHKAPPKSQNNAGGGSRAKGQPAGRQKKPASESKRADSRHKGEQKSKQERKKAIR